ncbi:YafY family protein [Legionella sp. km772]|uniref:helix-turn-helix transcriptional regulator n=1 Tax=Legionella sp. km772 TaxID=2498111 RepID=UPI000F8D79A9|nr:YafY family protein [Legionella sp. km772]RUR11313.1 YafY family transcriptional regulator [Legionella sp. km772]
MSRTQRLLDLLQLLRQHRYPISGKALAERLNISLRTLYRDIATLQSQGAAIEGEPGLGYVLRPGFMLPPLMFSEEEIEALVLGSRWVARRADDKLQTAAKNALAKISAVLPAPLRYQLESSGLMIGPTKTQYSNGHDILIRYAIRREFKLKLSYIDLNEHSSQRIIWPLALGFFDEVRMVIAWCELREDFRHFRTDRIKEVTVVEKPIDKRRQSLLKQWRELHSIPEQ